MGGGCHGGEFVEQYFECLGHDGNGNGKGGWCSLGWERDEFVYMLKTLRYLLVQSGPVQSIPVECSPVECSPVQLAQW